MCTTATNESKYDMVINENDLFFNCSNISYLEQIFIRKHRIAHTTVNV